MTSRSKKETTEEPVSLTNEQKFLEFLKENKIKLAFTLELKKHRGITLNEYLSRYSWRKFGANKVLQNSFPFIATEQGRDYWLEMNNKWKESIR